jgi:hypothetical protein
VHSALKIEPALERHALDGVVLEPVRTANALHDLTRKECEDGCQDEAGDEQQPRLQIHATGRVKFVVPE